MKGLIVGLRPDMLTVHVAPPEQSSLPVRVVMSELTGPDLLLHCDSPAGRLTAIAPRRDLQVEKRTYGSPLI